MLSYLFKTRGETLARWLSILVLAGSVAPGAQAQLPGSGHSKASADLLQKMDAGKAQDLIVVYDDKTIEDEVRLLQSEQGPHALHSRIIAHKAGQYARYKQASLAEVGTSETEVLRDYSHLPANLVRVHSRHALDRLLAQPGVAGVYANRIEQKLLAQSLPLVGQPQVAAQGNLGAGTTVAVLDTGVDYTHSAFGACTAPGVPASCKVVYAQDFAFSDGKRDDNGHGTNVAGIVAGVAPGAKIIALDVFGAAGTASSSDILSAISWVIANQANYNIVAMNLSLGSGSFTSPVASGVYNTAVVQARAAGVLTIAAAGNDGYTNALSQPAATSGVVSVGAVYDSKMGSFNWGSPLRCTDTSSAADKVTCFSNSASFLTLLAPGSQILAAGITEGGTSQASPHVAGAVAVLRSAFPTETLDQTVARLINGVQVTDSRNDIAKPRLNLPQALGVSAATCAYTLSEVSHSFDSNNGSASISVTTGPNCSWSAASAASNSGWITVTAGNSGTGIGTVSYSVAVNPNLAARTGSITVAGQTFTVAQSGSVGNLANVMLNSGFEDGPIAWTDSAANGLPLITTYLNPTNVTNSWYAWLCGYNNCLDTLYQDITVPADAQNAFVQFKYWIKSDESSGTSVYDSMVLRAFSPGNTSAGKSWTLSNVNATADWVQSPQYDVSAYRGQTIRIQFSASTDASLATDFLLDDVHLMVSGSAPDTQVPTVPSGLSAVAISTNAIRLSWMPATDNVAVNAYKIYRDGVLLASTGSVLSYSDTSLTAGASYSYTVLACDAAGNCSAQSLAVVAVTPSAISDTQAPTVPANLSGFGTSVSSLKLSWSAASDNIGVTQYKVYRNGSLLSALGKVSSYADSGLTPSTSYSYTVSACDAAGNCSAQSQAVSVSTLSPFNSSTPLIIDGVISVSSSGYLANISIGAITNRSYSMTSGSLRIELWAFATPFTGTELGYKTASIRTSAITGGLDQLTPRQSLTGLTLSLPYTPPPTVNSNIVVFVTEYSASCSQVDKFCYAYYVNLHESELPTVPTSLTASTVNSSQIDLAWTAATDNVGVATYKLYRNGVQIAVLGNVTSYSDLGLTALASYSYTVSACDAVGNCSAQSAATSATTPAAPDTLSPSVPSGLTATALSSSQVKLVWVAATDNVGVTAYKIYSGGALVTTLGNVTSTLRTTVASTSYRYTIAACDAVGNCSSQSAAASVTTPALADTVPPSVPAGLTAAPVNESKINLTWTAATDNVGVTSYKLYRGNGLLVTLGNVTSYSDTGLRGATLYSYTVQACDALSNCSALSPEVLATTSSVMTALALVQGWNLMGNSTDAPIQVATTFANSNQFVSVWKWLAPQSAWGFYAPDLAAQEGTVLADYAAAKGYQVLATIAGGEGYWVNVKKAVSISVPAGNVLSALSVGSTLIKGWNLISVGETVAPKQFCDAQSGAVTTLWAWDATGSSWYFYAPGLDASGALLNYASSKGYLDFTTSNKTLGAGIGFWVNKP